MCAQQGHLLPRFRTEYGWGILRIMLGWTFLWAFFDKLLGLGYATESGNGWIDGGHPTEGYLSYGVSGIFEDLYNDMAGNAAVDTLFMLGILAIGIALTLGIGMRLAFYGGAILMVLMWGSNVPPINNPITDQHLIYLVALFCLERVQAGKHIGLGTWWTNTPLVKRLPILE